MVTVFVFGGELQVVVQIETDIVGFAGDDQTLIRALLGDNDFTL